MERNLLRRRETEEGLTDDNSVGSSRRVHGEGQRKSFHGSFEDPEAFESPFLSNIGETGSHFLAAYAARGGADQPNDVRPVQRAVTVASLEEVPRLMDPNFGAREITSPTRENPEANETTLALGRIPMALVLHQFLNSQEMRQATLANLLGKAARRSVHVYGVDIPIPAYLRVVSRLCGEVAEQIEIEDTGIRQSRDKHHRDWKDPSFENSRSAGRPLEQNESQVAFDPFSPPQNIITALDGRDWAQALALAIQAGMRNANDLTDLIFFAKHKDLPHTALDAANPEFKQLAAEWSQIINDDVWTAIQAASENTALVVSGAEVCDIDRVVKLLPGCSRWRRRCCRRGLGRIGQTKIGADENPGLEPAWQNKVAARSILGIITILRSGGKS